MVAGQHLAERREHEAGPRRDLDARPLGPGLKALGQVRAAHDLDVADHAHEDDTAHRRRGRCGDEQAEACGQADRRPAWRVKRTAAHEEMVAGRGALCAENARPGPRGMMGDGSAPDLE